MPSMLVEIQETVKKYADIMSKVAQVEVVVVDENLFRVAGTGFFAEHVSEDMSREGYVYQHVLRTGSREIVYDPGREELCKACPKQNVCQEEIEISMPIRLGDVTIGVIGLVGSSREQKERVSSANDAARRQLSAKELEGKNVMVAPTGDSLNHQNEYRVVLDGKDFSSWASVRPA